MQTPTPGGVGYVQFPGCNVTSLLGWLKGLGLMAVTGQKGFWQSDRFYLEVESTSNVVESFLIDYRPKPIANPWNKDSGFLKPGGVDIYLKAQAERWSNVSKTFKQIQERLAREDLTKSSRELKILLYPVLGKAIDEQAFQDWLASVLLIREIKGKPVSALNPLLGNGGNVSRVDLGATYLNCCKTLWDLQTGEQTPIARTFVEAAIANAPLKKSLDEKGILCHLLPIADFFGELHNTSETEDYPDNGTSSQLANPVDFILAIEGLLNFSGSLKELEAGDFQDTNLAFYPLLLEVNSGSADTSDRSKLSKYEVWLPIWNQPMDIKNFRKKVLKDLKFRLSNQVSDTFDFLQALAKKSEHRNFNRYTRFGFWTRKGKGDYAIHIGLAVPECLDIVSELGEWRKFVKPHPNQSNELYNLFMALEKSLTALAKGTASIQKFLILLGRVELTLSKHEAPYHRPQPYLSEEWVKKAYEEKRSPEFRLAAALASTGLRRHISKARYSESKKLWFWSQQAYPVKAPSLTVLAGELFQRWDQDKYHPSKRFYIDKSSADTQQFIKEQAQSGARKIVPASLTDIQQFIEGVLDKSLILELAIGLSLCQIPNNLWEPDGLQLNNIPLVWMLLRQYNCMAGVLFLCKPKPAIPAVYQLAAKLLWDKKLNLNQAAINGLRRRSTIPLQSLARKQQINLAIPPTTSNGQSIATALIFPIDVRKVLERSKATKRREGI